MTISEAGVIPSREAIERFRKAVKEIVRIVKDAGIQDPRWQRHMRHKARNQARAKVRSWRNSRGEDRRKYRH